MIWFIHYIKSVVASSYDSVCYYTLYKFCRINKYLMNLYNHDLEKRLEKGRYHHVYRGKDKQWHFADSGVKDRNQDVTITLPQGKEQYR